MTQEIPDAIEAWGKGLAAVEEEESVEYLNWPHSRLLGEAWVELNTELQENGNTHYFLELRAKHSKRIVKYWLNKAKRCVEIWPTETLDVWREVDGENLRIIPAEDYHDEDTKIIMIERRTPLEHDVVTLSVTMEYGGGDSFSFVLDEFLRPPQIKSEIRTEPEQLENLHYNVIFRKNGISKFDRLEVYEDPKNERAYIKKSELIDCSIFGIEI